MAIIPPPLPPQAGQAGKDLKTNGYFPEWDFDTPGGGTVSSVSGVNANGFSWSIANPTTTPALTLSQANSVANGLTGAGAFTAGALLFGNGTGALQVDGSNLFWNNSSKQFAIGTNAPVAGYRVTQNGAWFQHDSTASGSGLAANFSASLGGYIPIDWSQGDGVNVSLGATWLSLNANGGYPLGNIFLASGSTDGNTGAKVNSGNYVGGFWAGADDGSGEFFCGSLAAGNNPLIAFVAGNSSTGNMPIYTAIYDCSSATTPNSVLEIGPDANRLVPGNPGVVALGAPLRQFKAIYLDYANTATVGNVTINKATGRVNLAAGATTLTVTNSLVTAGCHVLVTMTSDPGAVVSLWAMAAAGSFTLNSRPAVANQTAINFVVINGD